MACGGSNEDGFKDARIAAAAAKGYYEQLIAGDYAAFVDGRYQPNALPEAYRQQLIDNARMYADQQQKDRKGLKAVAVANAKADTARNVANAFLTLTFGDSTREEVVVPMVRKDGVWYMR